MTEFVLNAYRFMRSHPTLRWLSLGLSMLLMVALVTRLSYKEDISDFLPLDSEHHNALNVYQNISGANNLFAIFQYRDTTKADPDMMVAAIDRFVEQLEEDDSAHTLRSIIARVDLEKMSEVADFVYTNIPYFLTDADYARMDSLLCESNYIPQQLLQDKQMLMFPTGGLLADNIQRDPLNLFTPVVNKLQRSGSSMKYEMYDGCIFSPDMQRAVVVISSPYGASETENNAQLLTMVGESAAKIADSSTNIDVHLTGGPAIAVGNANQIKRDSIISVSLAVVLIVALLLLSFRSVRNILLIVVSIAWGWLFAMGGLALVHNSVSIIVIGISSVILGIAVNYPLHYIAHLSHTPNKAKALREIVMPLVVGNVTTVGAFLALVPLQSTALRDLGLFASFLLVGTIVFVLLYLPHLSATRKQAQPTFLNKIGEISPENNRYVVWGIVILTIFFGYHSLHTKFDTNMSHINYMDKEQRADMEYFSKNMTHNGDGATLYALSTATTLDSALNKSLNLQKTLGSLQTHGYIESHAGCSQFLCSREEQDRRLAMWNKFIEKHRSRILTELQVHGDKEGFSGDSFDEFAEILSVSYEPQDFTYFNVLAQNLFSNNVSVDSVSNSYCIVDVLAVNESNIESVKAQLADEGAYSFDVASMNSAIANHLSDDFNYIGLACSCIVFFFLWLSLGSFELAVLSFVPMAISWIWILGIMGLFGIQFNIVNIILATFIFGQGDDYTIFMTEGTSYEYAYRRRMLASYKHSIIISALIMFIGIGTLIVAKHPALHSLAQVTIAGMFSVVLMAYIFPPLIFKFLVSKGGKYRERPLSVKPLATMVLAKGIIFMQLLSVYVRAGILFATGRSSERRKQTLRQYIHRLCRFDLTHIPGVKFELRNPQGEDFARPALIVSNHQSEADLLALMALSPKLMILSQGQNSPSWIVRQISRWHNCGSQLQNIKELVKQSCSIALFSGGETDSLRSIGKLSEDAFVLAQDLNLDLLPIMLHGMNHAVSPRSMGIFKGQITAAILPRITVATQQAIGNTAEVAAHTQQIFAEQYAVLARSIETPEYFRPMVVDRYRYKGVEIFSEVKKNLRKPIDIPELNDGEAVFRNCGYGEQALLYALVHPETQVKVIETDANKALVAKYSAEDVAPNLKVIYEQETI